VGSAIQPSPAAAAPTLLTPFAGQPAGLRPLLTVEALGAFALYGTLSLLVLYLSGAILGQDRAREVAGLEGLISAAEAALGPLSTLATASLLFGMFAGAIGLTPLLGGLLGDRLFGRRATAAAGTMVAAFGYAGLVWAPSFLIGLLLVVTGFGLVTPNIKVQIGCLFGPDDPRRPRGFAADLVAINGGAFIGPFVCGGAAAALGWSYGFAAAALAGLAAAGVYWRAWPFLPPDIGAGRAEPEARQAAPGTIPALTAVIAINILYFGTYNQTFNMLPIWARDQVDRDFGLEVPVPWLVGLDGLFGILAGLGAIWLWARQARRGTEPHELGKMAIGFALLASAFATLAAGSVLAGGGKTSLAWCLPYFLLVALAGPFIFSSTLALISRCAPASAASVLMGCYALSASVGNLLTGWVGGFYEAVTPTSFWALHGVLAAAAIVLIAILRTIVGRALGLGHTGSDG
jgi:proton-dependent oligopeptide transporter, POT family